jgi:hypothetical protein
VLAGTVVVLIGLVAWVLPRGPGESAVPSKGEQVASFQLPDVVSGRDFQLSEYLGKKDIVIVSYMGFF